MSDSQPSVDELLEIIDQMRDTDPCWYDHHGHCQAHGWPYTEPRCPHARAAELFAEHPEGDSMR